MIKRLLNIFKRRTSIIEDSGVVPKRTDQGWKTSTTMNHVELVEEHLRTKAYYLAEKDGFQKSAEYYWEEAKRLS